MFRQHLRGVGSSRSTPTPPPQQPLPPSTVLLHGGANEEALHMPLQIGSVQKSSRIHQARQSRRNQAHGLRSPHLQKLRPARPHYQARSLRSFRCNGKKSAAEIALECERIALEDDYFVKRKLYPNVDFYTGLIYQSMGFPMSMFPVLFAIPRTSGWLAQWQEMLLDPEQKIARPRQIYLGHDTRPYVTIDQRKS